MLFLAFPKSLEHFPPNYFTDKQCLAANIFYEARGESERGMKAVAAVTYNRVATKGFPDTVCKVVFQRKQFSWTHQESYSRIVKILNAELDDFSEKDQKIYKKILDLVELPEVHLTQELPKGTVFYHSVKVKPYWTKFKAKVKQIGNHIFYKE